MRFIGTCYHAHDPRWSFLPTSGDGAAKWGGRFNPVGVPALYLAISLDGAIAEASLGFRKQIEPLTICQYDVDCDDIVDLRSEAGCNGQGIDWNDLSCSWKSEAAAGSTPASWRIAERLIASGTAGIFVPSFAHRASPDAANLVLWRFGLDLPHRVEVYDPTGRLPRNQLSWGDPAG